MSALASLLLVIIVGAAVYFLTLGKSGKATSSTPPSEDGFQVPPVKKPVQKPVPGEKPL